MIERLDTGMHPQVAKGSAPSQKVVGTCRASRYGVPPVHLLMSVGANWGIQKNWRGSAVCAGEGGLNVLRLPALRYVARGENLAMRYSFRLAQLLGFDPDTKKRPGTVKAIVDY